MGLDMYLSAKKYMSRYFDEADSDRIKGINELFGIEGSEDDDYGAQEIIFRVAYWRKANAIHQWFVQHVQNGQDDCNEYHVTREQLQRSATSPMTMQLPHQKSRSLGALLSVCLS